jgi:hypothetical protein
LIPGENKMPEQEEEEEDDDDDEDEEEEEEEDDDDDHGGGDRQSLGFGWTTLSIIAGKEFKKRFG